MPSNIHYSEGEFPLNLYGKPCYLNGFDLGMVNGSHWSGHGPLNSITGCCCGPNNTVALYITDVNFSASYTVTVTISYSNGSSKSVLLEKGKRYAFEYLENGTVNRVVGVVDAIAKMNNTVTGNCPCADQYSPDYVIQIDASSSYNSSVVTIRTSNLRGISYYVAYEDEDTTIASSVTRGATVIGTINNIRIENATIDSDGNILKGKITAGQISEENCIIDGGSSVGLNPNGHNIVVVNGQTTGGSITEGTIISASLTSPIVQGANIEGSNIVNAIITAPTGKVVAVNSSVTGGKTVNGTVIDPTINNSIVNGGTRYGSDMVTTGGTVVGGVCYGGTVSGGVLYGGTATGIINCDSFIIENGETTGGYSIKSIVYDGKVVGGKTIGNTIIGAVVYGGKAECGFSTGGTTTIGTSGTIRKGIGSVPDTITSPVENVDAKFFEKDIDDLIVWWKNIYGIGSSLGSPTLKV